MFVMLEVIQVRDLFSADGDVLKGEIRDLAGRHPPENVRFVEYAGFGCMGVLEMNPGEISRLTFVV